MSKRKKARGAAIVDGLLKTAQNGRIPVYSNRTGEREMVRPEEIVTVLQLSAEECRRQAIERVALNLRETGHPFHHRTADDTVVTPDPTLEYLMSRLSEDQREVFRQLYAATPEQEARAAKAVPVDRTYYGHDMYRGLI